MSNDQSEAEVKRLFREASPEAREEMTRLLRSYARLYGKPAEEREPGKDGEASK